MSGRCPEGGRSPTEGQRPGSLSLMPLLSRDDFLGTLVEHAQRMRAVANLPTVIVTGNQSNRLLGQHGGEIDQTAPPLELAGATDPPHGDTARVFHLRQAVRRGEGWCTLAGVRRPRASWERCQRRHRSAAAGLKACGQADAFFQRAMHDGDRFHWAWPGGCARGECRRRIHHFDNWLRPPAATEAKGGPLSVRSVSGRPYSRNTHSNQGLTASVVGWLRARHLKRLWLSVRVSSSASRQGYVALEVELVPERAVDQGPRIRGNAPTLASFPHQIRIFPAVLSAGQTSSFQARSRPGPKLWCASFVSTAQRSPASCRDGPGLRRDHRVPPVRGSDSPTGRSTCPVGRLIPLHRPFLV